MSTVSTIVKANTLILKENFLIICTIT